MDNKEIIKNLRTLAKLSEIQDVNPFKIRAINNAIFSLERAGKQLSTCTRDELEEIDGVGKSIAEQIVQLVDTGSCEELNNLLADTPSGILEISRLPGLGAKKVKTLWKELDIDSLDKLQEQIEKGNLSKVKGFGKKTEKNLSDALAFFISQKGKLLLPNAIALAKQLKSSLAEEFPDSRWEITGAVRRKCQIINRIELLGERKKQKALKFLKDSQEIELLPRESSPYILRAIWLDGSIPIWIRLADEDEFEFELFKSTGSTEHVEQVIEKSHATGRENESSLYELACMPVYPPEIRENPNPLDLSGDDLSALVTEESIQGILHAHSTYSDGKNTLEDMVKGAQSAGYKYLGITDHSKSSFFYANGLFENRIQEQHAEIDAINNKYPDFRIFKGIECDILPDGSLDYTNEVLESFDFIICSVHSVLNMDADTATKRLLKAIENPFTTILGHMTGRLLLRRQGYPVHMEYILEACAKNDVVIELNANANRLDVDWHWLSRMQEMGIKTSINPDAHSIEGYKDIQFGVAQARKGLIKKESNLTSFTLDELTDYFQVRKEKAITRV